jgi:hypothetical protein
MRRGAIPRVEKDDNSNDIKEKLSQLVREAVTKAKIKIKAEPKPPPVDNNRKRTRDEDIDSSANNSPSSQEGN